MNPFMASKRTTSTAALSASWLMILAHLASSFAASSAVLPSARLASFALKSTSDVESPRQLVIRGMEAFRRATSQADVAASIELFDKADDATGGQLRPFLWQRGISYYYVNKFKEGSSQFRYDVSVNPLDVEEIVWDIACLSQLHPSDIPPTSKMSLPLGRVDRRKIMATVYSLFRGDGATEQDLAAAGSSGRSSSDEFYSLFYLGLFCESRGDSTKASNYMRAAATSRYATGSGAGDYMSSVAKVHCQLRGWL